MHWKTLSTEIILKNDFFTIHKDRCKKANGDIAEEYYTIERPDAAIITAFTPKMELIMVNQYRHPVKTVDLEIPAGYIDPHENHIKKAAARELLEETGFKAKKLEQIRETFASAGLMNNKLHFFLAHDAEKIQEPELDENEELEVVIIPWKEALKKLEQGEIKDIASVLGILLAKEYLKNASKK